ncbi:MAG: SDR family oxidoreductase [Phycisphaerae bacterium]|nr:SDR family oxidoreductase [Phycisphaerae bacterium]
MHTNAQAAITKADAIVVHNLTVLLLTIIVMGLLVIVGLLASTLARWKRRQRPVPPPSLPSGRGPDPWEEAGRRASTPNPSRLEVAAVAAESGQRMMSGERPIALVTGGARRVGRAVALALARAGCDVVLTYHSSEADARDTATQIASSGRGASAHRVDMLDAGAVDLFAGFLLDGLPRLDVVVHNAGVYSPTPLDDLSAEEALQQFRVNALAPLILSARLAPLLARSDRPGGGSIVALLDIHAMGRPRRNFAAYAMSKAALTEMVISLARDLAPAVRVNGVAPGVVAWPENGPESDEAAQSKYLRRVPLDRAGTPEEAAEAVRWLALDAHYTTGQIVRVDGGRWMT